MRTALRLWLGIGILAVLSPLGIILPAYLKSSPWAEGGGAGLWSAPFADYSLKGWEDKGLGALSFAYIVSVAVGIAAVAVLSWVIGRFFIKKKD